VQSTHCTSHHSSNNIVSLGTADWKTLSYSALHDHFSAGVQTPLTSLLIRAFDGSLDCRTLEAHLCKIALKFWASHSTYGHVLS
jgi:hypothetical protein